MELRRPPPPGTVVGNILGVCIYIYIYIYMVKGSGFRA